MMRRFWSLVAVAIGGAVGVFTLVSSTYAAINEGDAIYQKALYEGVSNCYTTGSDAGGLIGEISLEAFDGSINKLVPNANGAGSKVVPVPGSDKGKLVNGLPGISCAELLSRRTDLKVSSAPVGGEAERKKTLENLQYTLVSGSGDNSSKKCFTFKYAGGTTAENKTIYSAPSVCISGKDRNRAWTVADNGNGVISFSGSGSSSLTVSASRTNFWGRAGENQEVDFWGNLTETRIVDLGGKTDGEALKAVGDAIVSILDTTFDKAVFETRRQVMRPGTTGNVTEVTKYYSPCYSYKVSSNKIECDAYESGFSASDFSGQFTSSANLFGTYKKPDVDRSSRSTTLPNILKSVSGNKFKTYGALALTDAEVYRLYLSYLQDDYEMSNFQCSDSVIDTSREYKDIRMWNASASKWMDHCNFDAKKSESLNNGSTSTQHTITVWGVYNDGERKNHFGNPVTLEQIVDWLRSANIKSDPGVTGGGTSGGSSSSGTPGGTSGSASSGSVNGTTDLCYNAGLESTEWILCPAMGNMEYTATAIDGVIQSWLEVRADTYDSSSNLYIGWEIVRNVANVVIVVVLVVIVFSQLTGYGIDNYGIKKMLPK